MRRGGRTAGGNVRGWYKKNEKKIKTAARVAGTAAAVAGTAYLGAKYGKRLGGAGKRIARLAANNRAPAVYSKTRAAYGKARGIVGAAGGKMRSAGGAVRSKANHLGYKAKTGVNTMRSRMTTPRLAANNQALAGNSKLRRVYGKTAGSVDALGRKARSVGGTIQSKANHAVYVGKSRAGELKRRATTTRIQPTGIARDSKVRRAYGKAAGAVESSARKAGSAVKSGAETVRSKAGHAAYVGKNRAKAAGSAAKSKAASVGNVVKKKAGDAKSKVRSVTDPNSQRNMRKRVNQKFANAHKNSTLSSNDSIRNRVNRGLNNVEQRARNAKATGDYYAAKAKNTVNNLRNSTVKRSGRNATKIGGSTKNGAARAAAQRVERRRQTVNKVKNAPRNVVRGVADYNRRNPNAKLVVGAAAGAGMTAYGVGRTAQQVRRYNNARKRGKKTASRR